MLLRVRTALQSNLLGVLAAAVFYHLPFGVLAFEDGSCAGSFLGKPRKQANRAVKLQRHYIGHFNKKVDLGSVERNEQLFCQHGRFADSPTAKIPLPMFILSGCKQSA